MQKHHLIRCSKSSEVISFGGEIQKRGILQDAFWELWWDSRKISLLTRFWIALCQQLSLFLETKTSIICDSSYWWWHGRNPICERPGTWYRVHAERVFRGISAWKIYLYYAIPISKGYCEASTERWNSRCACCLWKRICVEIILWKIVIGVKNEHGIWSSCTA